MFRWFGGGEVRSNFPWVLRFHVVYVIPNRHTVGIIPLYLTLHTSAYSIHECRDRYHEIDDIDDPLIAIGLGDRISKPFHMIFISFFSPCGISGTKSTLSSI